MVSFLNLLTFERTCKLLLRLKCFRSFDHGLRRHKSQILIIFRIVSMIYYHKVVYHYPSSIFRRLLLVWNFLILSQFSSFDYWAFIRLGKPLSLPLRSVL